MDSHRFVAKQLFRSEEREKRRAVIEKIFKAKQIKKYKKHNNISPLFKTKTNTETKRRGSKEMHEAYESRGRLQREIQLNAGQRLHGKLLRHVRGLHLARTQKYK